MESNWSGWDFGGVTNARNHLQDIAGLRIICYFVEDIYNLTAALKNSRTW